MAKWKGVRFWYGKSKVRILLLQESKTTEKTKRAKRTENNEKNEKNEDNTVIN